jgi:hypothetical protein
MSSSVQTEQQTTTKSSGRLRAWPRFHCSNTDCKRELLNAFGHQLCVLCGGKTQCLLDDGDGGDMSVVWELTMRAEKGVRDGRWWFGDYHNAEAKEAYERARVLEERVFPSLDERLMDILEYIKDATAQETPEGWRLHLGNVCKDQQAVYFLLSKALCPDLIFATKYHCFMEDSDL